MRRSNADTCSFFFKALGMAVGRGRGWGGGSRSEADTLKMLRFERNDFYFNMYGPLLRIFRKSKVVPFFFFF